MHKFLLIIILFIYVNALQAQSFFPYSVENKWGLVDREGKIIIPPTYDNILLPYPNKNNKVTIFQQDKSYGIINEQGKVLLKGFEWLTYDGNGAFVWYYDNNSNETGLHVFGIKEEKELTFYDSMKVKYDGVLGQENQFIVLKGKNNKHIVLNEEGKEIINANDVYSDIEIVYEEKDCPFFSYRIKGRSFKSFDCNGTPMSEDAYLDKYGEAEFEDYPMFENSGIYNPTNLNVDFQSMYPDFKIVKVIKNKNREAVSIVVKKEGSYGLVDTKGNQLLDFDYTAIQEYLDHLHIRKYGKVGFATKQGSIILDCNFAMIEKKPQDHGYIRVLTKNGYWCFANSRGKLFLPNGVTYK